MRPEIKIRDMARALVEINADLGDERAVMFWLMEEYSHDDVIAYLDDAIEQARALKAALASPTDL